MSEGIAKAMSDLYGNVSFGGGGGLGSCSGATCPAGPVGQCTPRSQGGSRGNLDFNCSGSAVDEIGSGVGVVGAFATGGLSAGAWATVATGAAIIGTRTRSGRN